MGVIEHGDFILAGLPFVFGFFDDVFVAMIEITGAVFDIEGLQFADELVIVPNMKCIE